MNDSIDYRPLAYYSKLFRLFKIARRVRMIVVRIALALALVIVIGWMFWAYNWANEQIDRRSGQTSTSQTQSTTYDYEFNSEGKTYDIGWVFWLPILLIVGPFLLSVIIMSNAWDTFAKKNGFSVLSPMDPGTKEIMNVPSFKGKLFALSVGPIKGSFKGHTFALHSRQYKEGGVLRWREAQMDTVLTLFIPATLPHIVINARGNERARVSNLSQKFPINYKFQFEGSMGAKYDVFTKPQSRVITLQLFTPDVLEVLYNTLPNADIELLGNKLWIVQRFGVLDDVMAQTMLETGVELYAELEKQIKVAGLLYESEQATVQ